LFTGDALVFDWKKVINGFTGFEIILGNPPYVCSRHLSEETKKKLKNWEVCNSGHPDLYIPFFQIGIETLRQDGVLGFITMNSFFKSLNGRALREYFQKYKLAFKIIDFGAVQVFRSKNTYTCICLIETRKQAFIKYAKAKDKNPHLPENSFSKIDYARLDSKKGWNLQDNEIIAQIEQTGIAFGDLYKTRHGIATLRNDVFIFKPVKEDKDFYYLQNGNLYQIEKGICKDIVNSNKLSRPSTLGKLKEKVIFPYDHNNKPKLLDEQFLKEKFPKAYEYLENKRNLLDERDKGRGKYENWFAFGRKQSLENIKTKLFFPKLADRTPNYIINTDNDLFFYNGLAIVGGTMKELTVIKKILESRVFWFYIQKTSKPYSSNYYSLNGNYIQNFGICNLDKNEIDFLVKERDQQVLDKFFDNKYNLSSHI
jgi:adenine-specific DNA-methyltransferase